MPFDVWNWSGRRGERMRYLRRLPWRSRMWLFAAVAATFSTIGFVTDLSRLTTPHSDLAVLVSAGVSGLIACGYLAAALYGTRWLPLAAIAQLGLLWGMKGVYAALPPAEGAGSLEGIVAHARFDALGLLAGVIAGYALFIGFISRMGLRQVRLDTEIKLAQEIHAHLVPPIARRTSGGLEIVGRSLPSSEVGGDLLDVVERGGQTLALVADVSGHGVQAGTLMAMVRSAVRVHAAGGFELPGLFAVLDDVIVELGRPDKFVTAAALRFDGPGGAGGAAAAAGGREVEAMLAGHLPILVVRAVTGAVERVVNQRPPLGLPRPADVVRVGYAPGDLFAILTDGLTEVDDGKGAHLGLEAIEAVLVERRADPLEAIADAVFERTRRHGKADDDRTLLLVRATRA